MHIRFQICLPLKYVHRVGLKLLLCYFGLVSCWKMKRHLSLRSREIWSRISSWMPLYVAAFIVASILTSCLNPSSCCQKTSPHHDVVTTMLHCRDDIGQVMNSAWFPPGMTLGIQTKDSNLCFISPKNFVSHGRRVLQVPFGKLVLLRSDYSVWPPCHTGVICCICSSQVGRAVSSRKSPGEF